MKVYSTMVLADLGDILYVVLIIAFGIFGAIGKTKKKRKPVFNDDEESVTPSFWEELQREMGGKAEPILEDTYAEDDHMHEQAEHEVFEAEPVHEPIQEPIISSELEHRDSYTYTDAQLHQESVEYASPHLHKRSHTQIAARHHKKASFKLQLNNIDELKKGIIYAEIFNRKYV